MAVGKPTYGAGIWISPNGWYLIADEDGDGRADSIAEPPTGYASGYWKKYELVISGTNTEELARRLFGDKWKTELKFLPVDSGFFSELKSPQIVASENGDPLIAGLSGFNLGAWSGFLCTIGIAALSETALAVAVALGFVSLVDRLKNLIIGTSDGSMNPEAIAEEIGFLSGGIFGSAAGLSAAGGAGLLRSTPVIRPSEGTNADVIDLFPHAPRDSYAYGGYAPGRYSGDVIVRGTTLIKAEASPRPHLRMVTNRMEELDPAEIPETNPEIVIPLFEPNPPPEIVWPPAEPFPEIVIPWNEPPPSEYFGDEDIETDAPEEEFWQIEGPVVAPLDIDTNPAPITITASDENGGEGGDAPAVPLIRVEPIPAVVEETIPTESPGEETLELRERLTDEMSKPEINRNDDFIKAIIERLYALGDRNYLIHYTTGFVSAVAWLLETRRIMERIVMEIEREAYGARRGERLVKLIDALLKVAPDFQSVVRMLPAFTGMIGLAQGLMLSRTPDDVKRDLHQALRIGNYEMINILVGQLIDYGEDEFLIKHEDPLVRTIYEDCIEQDGGEKQKRSLNLKTALHVAVLRNDWKSIKAIAGRFREIGEMDYLLGHKNPRIASLALRMTEGEEETDELAEMKRTVTDMISMGTYLLRYRGGKPEYNEDFKNALIAIYEAGDNLFLISLGGESGLHVGNILNDYETAIVALAGKVEQVREALHNQNFGRAIRLIEEISKQPGGWNALRRMDDPFATELMFRIFGGFGSKPAAIPAKKN